MPLARARVLPARVARTVPRAPTAPTATGVVLRAARRAVPAVTSSPGSREFFLLALPKTPFSIWEADSFRDGAID